MLLVLDSIARLLATTMLLMIMLTNASLQKTKEELQGREKQKKHVCFWPFATVVPKIIPFESTRGKSCWFPL